jgi:hypothetical protein
LTRTLPTFVGFLLPEIHPNPAHNFSLSKDLSNYGRIDHPKLSLLIGNELLCEVTHPVWEDVLLGEDFEIVALLYLYPGIVEKSQKEKRKNLVLVSGSTLSLSEYFDLLWCLHDDLWRPSIFLDDTNDLHFFIQVIGIWGIGKSRKIAGKDHSSTILVVRMKIEETHSTGVVGIYDCPLNNYVLVVVVFSF